MQLHHAPVEPRAGFAKLVYAVVVLATKRLWFRPGAAYLPLVQHVLCNEKLARVALQHEGVAHVLIIQIQLDDQDPGDIDGLCGGTAEQQQEGNDALKA